MRFIRTRLRDRSEDGAVFVILSISMVVLLLFAAFAIDLATVWVERRNDQNAADVGGLSGAQFTAGLGEAAAIAAAETEVRRITAQNLGVTDAEWDACTDTGALAKQSSTPCVSFDHDLTLMRVRVPDQTVDTIFASIIGIDTLTTNAFAEVEIDLDAGGDVLPFGFGPTAAANTEICLQDGGGNALPPPCDGPDDGNFGYLDFKRYSVPGNGCNTGFLIENMSAGVDHSVAARDFAPGAIHDSAQSGSPHACPNGDGRVDRTQPETGNAKLHDGMVDGKGSFEGRLTQGPWPKESVLGGELDDWPLWSFMDTTGLSVGAPAAATIPMSCQTITNHDEMITCIDDYNTGGYTADLFTLKAGGDDPKEYDLLESPRWAYVPQLHQDWSSGASGVYEFVVFQPIFIQTIFYKCSNTCNEFDPGEGTAPSGGNKAQSMTGIQIPMEMLPKAVNDRAPGTEESVQYVLVR